MILSFHFAGCFSAGDCLLIELKSSKWFVLAFLMMCLSACVRASFCVCESVRERELMQIGVQHITSL